MNINEYSFYSLFGEHTMPDGKKFKINQIEIPIIQRDYAQGRKNDSVSRVRERFLETIHEALENNRHLTLDFVYGEVENGKLIPLDGQQRLTTLFLLHWFASKKECISKEDCAFLNNFTYYTRPSSRDFCQKLVDFTPDLEGVISKDIKNQSWFQYQWQNNPTIDGMLVMIDAIQEKFNSMANLWQRLIKEESVSFYFLPITEMGLTDELYIKMNSRGKPLTPFEHFKAEFESMIREYDDATSIEIKTSNEINKKFDLDWTDMLFPYRGDNNIIDEEFMRYFFFVSDMLWYQQQEGLPERDEFKLAKILYGKENPCAKENIKFLIDAFDCWCGFDIDTFFGTIFSGRQYEINKTKIFQEDVNLFKQCCYNYRQYVNRNRKFSLNNTLLLFAVVVYLQNKHDISKEEFLIRIRIIRNLIWNSQFEIRADGQRNNMPKLLAETRVVITTGEIPIDGAYNQNQKEEERAKQEWLTRNQKYKEELFHLEDHDLLSGCIAIVGLDNPDNFRKFRDLFNNCSRKLITSSLLVFGDYSQMLDDWRWQMGTTSERNNSTWQDLFHPSKQRTGFENTKKVLNAMLYSSEVFSDDVLQKIIEVYLSNPETKKDWLYYFVKYPAMLSDTYGMYYTYDDGVFHTLKMRTSERLSGWNWNVFTLALYFALNEKYPLGSYAYQGDKLRLSAELSLDSMNDRFVLYRQSAEDNVDYVIEEYPLPSESPFMDETGIDREDRVEYGVRLVNQIVSDLDRYLVSPSTVPNGSVRKA